MKAKQKFLATATILALVVMGTAMAGIVQTGRRNIPAGRTEEIIEVWLGSSGFDAYTLNRGAFTFETGHTGVVEIAIADADWSVQTLVATNPAVSKAVPWKYTASTNDTSTVVKTLQIKVTPSSTATPSVFLYSIYAE